MKTQVLTFGGVRLVVIAATPATDAVRMALMRRLVKGLPRDADEIEIMENNARSEFCHVVSQTIEVHGLGFTLPDKTVSDEILEAAWQGFLETDAELVDQWVNAIRQLDMNINPN